MTLWGPCQGWCPIGWCSRSRFVYAYVSRGQLGSRREPGGRGSTFDAKEVEALARRNRREGSGSSGSGGELSVRTRITLIDKDRYYFRGVDATELAARHSYEEVAEWLWTGELRPGITFTAPEASVAVARRAVDALPEHTGPTDRLRVAAIAAATADPLRFDLSEGPGQPSVRITPMTCQGTCNKQSALQTRPADSGPSDQVLRSHRLHPTE